MDIFVDCYLEHNLGDDLFLMTLLERYQNRQDLVFHIWADSTYQYLSQRYSNVVVHLVPQVQGNLLRRLASQRDARHRRLLNLKSCRVSVQIGGSIFMEWRGGNLAKRFRYWSVQRRWLKHLYSLPEAAFVIGSNFGPWQTWHYKHAMHELFRRYCTDICFRDEYSADLFSDLRNVRCAPDVLFGVDIPQEAQQRKLFISVIDVARKVPKRSEKKAEYENWLIEQAKLMAKRGYTIVLCSFCTFEGDSRVVTELSQRLSENGIEAELLNYDTNDREILAQIASSEYVIASRFHAAILALAAGCKVLPVLYSDKTRHVLEDLGYPMDNCVDLLSTDDGIFNHDVIGCEAFPVDEAIKASERQFLALDEWLDSAK